MLPRPRLAAALLACSLPFAAAAQAPAVGQPAPPIDAAEWLNWQGDPPSLASCKGRVVLLEFWGTWCGPCVRAMPAIQKLHDRYRDRGLTVLAISYEPKATLAPFLTQHGYTMPVGADVAKKTIGAYPIKGWPTTVVIGKDGVIAHVGSPYDAEAAVEKALGLEAGPAALLDAWLATQATADRAGKRAALERLVEKAPPDFDLRAWARGHVPAETVGDGGAAPPAVPAAPAASAPKPVAAKPGAPGDAADTLRRAAAAWANAAQRAPLLRQLADGAPEQFDLGTFAQEAFGKAFPLDAAELKSMLADKQYAAALDALASRAPAAAVAASASKHADLAAWCRGRSAQARDLAKKGVMAQRLFANALPRDKEQNDAFQRELAMSGASFSKDRKQILGVMLGGEVVQRDRADAWVRSHLVQAVLAEDIAAGRPPRVKDVGRLVAKERDAIERDLQARYGKPEPVPQDPPK